MEVIIFLLPLALLWVLMIRPQQQRVRQAREMTASLEVGDEVVTAGGIYGTVTDADDDILSVEVAPGVVLRVLRGAIAQRVGPPREYEYEEDDEDETGSVDSPLGDDET
ncbi:MAG TPA: preprotein translocase subunit YajC [Acidimicrobiales bacterium]|nr:preprotein translocase subunit YajC [Acidimicrobiales bacterium]